MKTRRVRAGRIRQCRGRSSIGGMIIPKALHLVKRKGIFSQLERIA
jgi:hypothetical protein